MQATSKIQYPCETDPLPSASRHLHVLAGIVLAVFGISHFAFLTIPDISHQMANTVFPFLTNRYVYLSAGTLELLSGIYCLRNRGAARTNVAILLFVGIIIWYRWAFEYTGGKQCNCLGFLGRLLRVSKKTEHALPVIALVFLAACTLPWQIRHLGRLLKSRALCWIAFISLSCTGVLGNTVVRISGELDAARYRPLQGTVFEETPVHVLYTVTLSGDTWKICATNQNNPAWWGHIASDGTNIYTLNPLGGYLYSGDAPETNRIQATVSRSAIWSPAVHDTIGLSIIWLTYGFSPQKTAPSRNGVYEFGLPWWLPHGTPQSYGYKWVFTPTDGRFADSLKVYRDRTLDLSDRDELKRATLDYPDTLGQRNQFIESLDYRRGITNGFLEAEFLCTAWSRTNGISLPIASEFKFWLAERAPNYPNFKASLRTTAVTFENRSEPETLWPAPPMATVVRDYRYRKSNSSRIFRHAKYELMPGAGWKPDNDPALLAEADEWLRNGRKFDEFESGKNNLAFLLLGSLILFPVAVRLMAGNKKHKHNKT